MCNVVRLDVVCMCAAYIRIHILDWRNGAIYWMRNGFVMVRLFVVCVCVWYMYAFISLIGEMVRYIG